MVLLYGVLILRALSKCYGVLIVLICFRINYEDRSAPKETHTKTEAIRTNNEKTNGAGPPSFAPLCSSRGFTLPKVKGFQDM